MSHFYCHVIILSSKRCVDKILKQKFKKSISCNYCQKEHAIKSSAQLKPNLNFINSIKSNFQDIYSIFVEKLKTSRYDIEGIYVVNKVYFKKSELCVIKVKNEG